MAYSIKSLADLKRILATPGVRVQGISHSRMPEARPEFKHDFYAPRELGHLQSNAFTLKPIQGVNVSWVYLETAKKWLFDGSDVVRTADGVLTYRILEPATASA